LGIGKSGVGGFITNALGGNVFSGATDLIQSIGSGEAGGHSVFYNMGQGVAAGPTQGFGAPFSKAMDGTPLASGPADVATGAILRSGYALETADYTAPGVFAATFASEEALQFATGVGEVKLGVDAGIYALGLAKCAAGK
jgi:hypothetical protein